MSQSLDFAARIRSSISAARSSESINIDKRARGFIMLLAGTLQMDDPQLAAELFTLLVNTGMPQSAGVSLLVDGGVK